jgi:hypothetical protein
MEAVMEVFNPVKSRTNGPVTESETLGDVTIEADKKMIMCEAVNCFEEATNNIEVQAGNHRTISLSLCNICVNKFVGDD